ncbi:MAG: SEC-C metal-binding domain-containing protein, partial [Eubacteriales bacterium]|nr:SEC-C metal-binding domain-containing protein [Eubacteriales bacterium]
YKKILGDYTNTVEGKLSDLAKEFNMDEVTFVGFLDGINSSLKKEIKLDSLKSGSKVTLDIDFEKLYYNMLDCKAEWLYTLKEWEPILTPERRKEITQEFRTSKMFVKTAEPGRNDPCPCGSGKKYKKCCGAGK